MNERELLELAAKAAGVELLDWRENWPDYGGAAWRTKARELWNPLADDGDAQRLAIDLGISVIHADTYVYTLGFAECDEMFGQDKYAATRRAIVRAAAEMGKEMS